jgi:TP901 family phage tail tape measure protein
MDLSDVKAASADFIQSLQAQEQGVFQLFEKMSQMNKEGDVTKRVIEGINNEGTKIEATLKKVGDGWQVMTTKIKQATDALKAVKAEQARAAGLEKANTGESILTNAFDTKGLGLSQANSVEGAIQRIKSVLASGKVEVERFQELLAKFQQDPKAILPGLTAEEAAIVKSFRSIQNSIESAARQRNSEAEQAATAAQKIIDGEQKKVSAVEKTKQAVLRGQQGEDFIRSQFDFSKIDPSKLSSVETALQRIKTALADGKVSFERFQEIFNKLKANPNQILPNLSAEEQKVASAVRTLVEGFGEKVPNAVSKSEKIFISLGGVLRLLEAQILKRVFAVLENEILQSVSAAQKFTVQVAEIMTISQAAQLTTQQWGQGLTQLSNKFGNPQTDVAEAAYQAISNQVAKGAESFKFLDSALSFGQATVTSATDSVNLLSGAIQSFGLAASDSDRIGAILFKTIELGRVRGREMADTFGRVGTLARDAGVKLEEISAAIAVLTNRGIKFNDASTLIQNVLLKLIRPTDEMKELFKEWGVSSGTAAIATFGFQGVLARLDVEAGKGTGRLADLLGQIRAIRGVIGLTGGAFDDFNKYLGQITGAQEEYARAQQLVAQSPGRRAQQEIAQIRNFFEQDFGEPFLKGLLAISDALGGTVNVIKTTILAVQGLAGGYIAYRAVQLALLPVMSTEIGLRSILNVVMGANAINYRAVGAAALASAPAIIALTAAFAGGYFIGERLFGGATKSFEEVRAAAIQTSEELDRQRMRIREAENRSDDEAVQRTRQAYATRIQSVLTYSTAVLRLANNVRQQSIDNLRDTTNALKTGSAAYFDTLKKRISDLGTVSTEAKNLIKASLKESEDLARRSSQRIFDTRLKYANPGQQDQNTGAIFGDQRSEVIRNRIADLLLRARDEFRKGTTESIQEGRKLFNDIEKLKQELFDVEIEKQRRTFDFQAQHGQIAPSIGADGRARYEFTVRTADLEREINDITSERLSLERQHRREQEARRVAAEQEAASERDRLRQLQQAFRQIEQIEVLNREGKIKDEFKGPGGLQRVLGQFDEQRQRILELAQQDQDPRASFQIFRDLAAQRAALIQTVFATMRTETATQVQENATRDIQTSERLTTQARERLTGFRNDVDRNLRGLREQIAIIEERALTPIRTNRTIAGIDTGIETSESQEAREAAEPARLATLTRINTLRAVQSQFNDNRTEANARLLQQAIRSVNVQLEEYVRLRGLPKPDELFLGGDTSGLSLQGRINGVDQAGRSIVENIQGIAQTEAQLRQAAQSAAALDQRFREMPGAIQAMNQAALAAAPSTQATFNTLSQAASNYAQQLERVNEALRQQADILPARRGDRDAPVPGNMFGGAPKYYNAGGYVGFVPRGSDQVPAMLGRDEFVMTSAATKQFMPLLKAMNSGTMPRYMNQGGPVTNVGDITVNVSGGQTDSESLRNIATGLRRGIRRGTISLDK